MLKGLHRDLKAESESLTSVLLQQKSQLLWIRKWGLALLVQERRKGVADLEDGVLERCRDEADVPAIFGDGRGVLADASVAGSCTRSFDQRWKRVPIGWAGNRDHSYVDLDRTLCATR